MTSKKKPVQKNSSSRDAQVYHFSIRWHGFVFNPDADNAGYAKHQQTLEQFTEKNLQIFRDHCESTFDKWIFQIERGSKFGLLHFQGYGHKVVKARPRALGAIWGSDGVPGVEIQCCSTAGVNALKNYAMKKETRESGPWADKPIYMGADLIKNLHPWQQAIKDLIGTKPHDRIIYWFYDKVGGSGKSSFAKYMMFHHKVVTLTFGDAKDLLFVVQKFQNRPCYMFDLSRTKGGKTSMSDIYQALESVKNGYFVSSKYESDIVLMQTPHVIVFSNHYPDMGALSQDRWRVVNMNEHDLGANGAKEIIVPNPDGNVFQRSAVGKKRKNLDPVQKFLSSRPKKKVRFGGSGNFSDENREIFGHNCSEHENTPLENLSHEGLPRKSVSQVPASCPQDGQGCPPVHEIVQATQPIAKPTLVRQSAYCPPEVQKKDR